MYKLLKKYKVAALNFEIPIYRNSKLVNLQNIQLKNRFDRGDIHYFHFILILQDLCDVIIKIYLSLPGVVILKKR